MRYALAPLAKESYVDYACLESGEAPRVSRSSEDLVGSNSSIGILSRGTPPSRPTFEQADCATLATRTETTARSRIFWWRRGGTTKVEHDLS